MRIPNPRHLLALLVCIALLSSPALAESEWDAAVADTSSPRATLRSFIDACNAIDRIVKSQAFVDRSNPRFQPIAQRVIDCIDTSKLPAFAAEQRALEVAVSIKKIWIAKSYQHGMRSRTSKPSIHRVGSTSSLVGEFRALV
ncbi:hypothetical protein SV7mr_24930 [Stieleria bergensis]|uniref:Uncharacterized protein n=1 Tax=Stieleria bergensis TaxID=2528025 RepID=A0A517SV31_9BACT|nr:hypothetical protein SV7mr_24930 [Planctomycetes bacterium SV_7m_r]